MQAVAAVNRIDAGFGRPDSSIHLARFILSSSVVACSPELKLPRFPPDDSAGNLSLPSGGLEELGVGPAAAGHAWDWQTERKEIAYSTAERRTTGGAWCPGICGIFSEGKVTL